MAANGMTAIPVFLALAAITELVAGAALLVGFKTRLAAAALFLYLIPVTLVFHDFWTLTGANRQMQMISFLKNLAVMGGLAEVFAFGPGRISLDARLPRRGRLGGILEDRHAV
jgi:putative oxidoreductase